MAAEQAECQSLERERLGVWLQPDFPKKLQGCVLGSCNSHRDVPNFLALWRKGALDLESMITHRRPVEDVNAGLDDMRASRGLRTVLSF